MSKILLRGGSFYQEEIECGRGIDHYEKKTGTRDEEVARNAKPLSISLKKTVGEGTNVVGG